MAVAREKPNSYRSREYNPNNPLAFQRKPEPWFLEELHKIDPNLEITWNPMMELWQVWVVDLTIGQSRATEYTRGWRLLFTLRENGGYAPLDNRLFALLYAHDMERFGGAEGYYQHLRQQQEREQEAVEKAKFHCSQETARGLFDHFKPMVSMRGRNDGNKVGKFG